MKEAVVKKLLDEFDDNLKYFTIEAHKNNFLLSFEGTQELTQQEVTSIWAQGQKDAIRNVITRLQQESEMGWGVR